MNELTRRSFASGAGVLSAASYSRVPGANDRVRMGYIGLGNRGDQVHDAFLEHGDQQTVAVCDLRHDYMDFAIKKSRATPKKYDDYQQAARRQRRGRGGHRDARPLARADVHRRLQRRQGRLCREAAVLTVVEGRKMVETAARTQPCDAGGHPSALMENVPAGDAFRPLRRHRPYHRRAVLPRHELMAQRHRAAGRTARRRAEAEWDQWLGPAPKVPYNQNRMFYNFRWFYDYSGGQLTNFGVHYMDMMRWCLGRKRRAR